MTERTAAPAQPSLRRRLLAFLLIPVGLMLVLDALLTYSVALAYSNRVHDHDLMDDAVSLAQLVRTVAPGEGLSSQARFLLEYDPDGPNYFSVRSRLRGELSSNAQFAEPAPPAPGAPARLYNSQLGTHHLRGAIASVRSDRDPGDVLTVTVAETLRDRHRRAGQILALTVPLQALLIAAVLSLVWFGVNYGLRVLDPLTARLAARQRDITPIGEADVPREILPLTRTIDALFGRLRAALDLQERFIADAAHQLRTPLAGLSLHVERALAEDNPEARRDALAHVRQLTMRTARTAAQLLALTRAQSPLTMQASPTRIDMAQQVPLMVGLRVHEALAAGVDLGFQGPAGPLWSTADPADLQELLDNLIDNGLRYAGRGCSVTVVVAAAPDGGVRLSVEDDGPGVPDALLPRLGERFFRAGPHGEAGSGLGLAIVERIAERHHARVRYRRSAQHGLSVDVHFPPATVA